MTQLDPNSATARNYRDTLNLPKTAFPMRADLPKREPDRVAWWEQNGTYERRLAANKANGPWILHDGPPYANGEMHMGHFLNRILKDALVKIHLLDGKWADFIPGWDMHGLPIERDTLKHLGLDFHKIAPVELRDACRERALYWLDIQRATILRMGVFGKYDEPYRTIDPSFEAVIVETLADLAERDQLYKGLRSTLWCVYDETALAEAEIEYKDDHVSPSIYVRFTANDAQRADLLERFGLAGASGADVPASIAVLIWTTTPWTLPANVAIALKDDAAYGLYRVTHADGRVEGLILAEALAPATFARLGEGARIEQLASAPGTALAEARVRHPFLDRDSLIVLADYVELDAGTGAVHTAPGHGTDDFETGLKYGLPTLNPVDNAGHFTAEAGPYAGQFIFDANANIVADLRASGALYFDEPYRHSYPHCWRCHNPVIFRATAQWFIGMDRNDLRTRAETAARTVAWNPAWGGDRMVQMIANHPEWCLSRQRTWGTPIPAFVCNACNESILDAGVTRSIAARFARDGANVWWTEPADAFLPEGFTCPNCEGTTFSKEMNIVDIWFESGVTHRAVLPTREGVWPADAYLEGMDQYRGWFRSNLLTAVATMDAAPYRTVYSTGWVNDENGRAMSKSLGNYIAAGDAMQKYGADVLRLWVSSVDYEQDVKLGPTLLENVGNVYRNLRNRLRYLLGALDGLEPGGIVQRAQMEPFDRLALASLDAMAATVVEQLLAFKLHDAYLTITSFDTDDLSRIYVDAIKDRLYSSARQAKRRRSAQSACLEMLRTLSVLLAPILSFTTEEAWQNVPEALRDGAQSVFDLTFPRVGAVDEKSLALWELLKTLRAQVAANTSGRDFELAATVIVPNDLYDAVVALGDDLREALIVSQVIGVERSPDASARVLLEPASGEKCERCWKYRELGTDPEHPRLCADCAEIVREIDSAA